MKLREPRVEIPPSTWSRDMLKLFHPLMFAPILMLVTIGTFLAPQLDLIRYILELIGVSCAVICAYHLDEYMEKTTAPSVPRYHNKIIVWIGMAIGCFIAGHFTGKMPILIVPVIMALCGVFLYNLDIIKSRVLYATVWGGVPIFGSYMLQTGTWPNLTVLVFTVFGMLLATKLFWNWSLRTCGRWTVCHKGEKGRLCHSPGTICCLDRLEMPKECNDTMKVLQKLDLLILFAIMWGVILF